MPDSKRIAWFVNTETVASDVLTLLLSYAFILLAAWNDGLLGLPSNVFTIAGEYALALGLACEIFLRLRYTKHRPWYFYPLIVVDAVAVLTVIPSLDYVTFARLIRLIVSGARMFQLIDRVSRSRGNPYLVLLIYPLVVPIAAALFFALERGAPHTQVHNYFQALVLMVSYSLTIGIAANHPVTYAGKAIAGVMLLAGFLCVSILGNALTDRYTIARTQKVSSEPGPPEEAG